MKNITKLLIASSLLVSSLLVSSATYADQIEHKKFDVQINLGGSYTNLNDFDGEGYKVTAKVIFPMEVNSVDIYGKVSHQVSHDEKQGNDFYFDESELSLGIAYNINNEHLIFLEGGDIKQTFEKDEQGVWKDYLYVARLGTSIQQGNYNIQVALEHRNGLNRATGYSTSVGFFQNIMRISFTDVGEYQSLAFSFQANF